MTGRTPLTCDDTPMHMDVTAARLHRLALVVATIRRTVGDAADATGPQEVTT